MCLVHYLLFFTFGTFEPLEPCRWYDTICRLGLGSITVPQLLEQTGGTFLVQDTGLVVLWPWDLIQWWDSAGGLEGWIANEPSKASMSAKLLC